MSKKKKRSLISQVVQPRDFDPDEDPLTLRGGMNNFTPLREDVDIVYCNYDEEGMSRIRHEELEAHEHLIVWKVGVNKPNLDGKEVLRQVRLLRADDFSNEKFNQPPRIRVDYYQFGSSADPSSFAQDISCELIDNKHVWQFRMIARYSPPSDAGSQIVWIRPLPSDPMQWPIIPWVEFIEDTKVVEQAFCMTNLSTIKRGPLFDKGYGPLVNAVGQQTIDPITETTHRIIMKARVNYPDYTYGLALQKQFERTVHAPDAMFAPNEYIDDTIIEYQYLEIDDGLPLFAGYPHGTWKFNVAEIEHEEYRVGANDDIVKFTPVVIAIEHKYGEIHEQFFLPDDEHADADGYLRYWTGWVHKVLNNGQVCFRKLKDAFGHSGNPVSKWIPDPRYGDPTDPANPEHKLTMPTTVQIIKEDFDLGEEDTRDAPTEARPMPSKNDLQEIPSSEPLNLHADGTQITDPLEPANHILYASLFPANFYDMTDYYGRPFWPSSLSLPEFPLDETDPPTED